MLDVASVHARTHEWGESVKKMGFNKPLSRISQYLGVRASPHLIGLVASPLNKP